ncbi:MAG: hypothetical protein AB7H90_22465 [Alphaproteobacteria bacterium]
MAVHKKAPLTLAGREIMVGRVIAGQTPKVVAAPSGFASRRSLQDGQ